MHLESITIRPTPVHAIIRLTTLIILLATLYSVFIFGMDYVHEQHYLGRIFRYGTITVARPRLKDYFELKNISDPAKQLHLIQSAMGEKKNDSLP